MLCKLFILRRIIRRISNVQSLQVTNEGGFTDWNEMTVTFSHSKCLSDKEISHVKNLLEDRDDAEVTLLVAEKLKLF